MSSRLLVTSINISIHIQGVSNPAHSICRICPALAYARLDLKSMARFEGQVKGQPISIADSLCMAGCRRINCLKREVPDRDKEGGNWK